MKVISLSGTLLKTQYMLVTGIQGSVTITYLICQKFCFDLLYFLFTMFSDLCPLIINTLIKLL